MRNLLLLILLLSNTILLSQSVPYSENQSEWVWDRNQPIYNSRFQSIYSMPTSNDNCSNATTLNINDPCTNGSTSTNTIETNENTNFPCNGIGGGGVTPRSSWYRINSDTNSSLNITIDRVGSPTNCGYHVAVYGPFSPGGGCLPTSAQSIYCEDFLDLYDPGFHFQISSLSPNSDYLIQIMNEDCGGGNSRTIDYCIAVYTPTPNNLSSGANLIDQCGVSVNGTNIGYTPSNGLPGNEDLDNNATTQCPTCPTAGEDVPYVVNNDSWFYFCATTAGTWNIDFTNISNCVQGMTSGLQMTLFRGTPNNLTVIEHAPSPSVPGSSWTSSNFNVSVGECIYLVVDGFAGDQCDYSYTLNNVTGGCNILLDQLKEFSGYSLKDKNYLEWGISEGVDGLVFNLLKSKDGVIFHKIDEVNSENNVKNYNYSDYNPNNGLNYYRLFYKTLDDDVYISNIVVLENYKTNNALIFPNPFKNKVIIKDIGENIKNVKIYDNLGKNIKNFSNLVYTNYGVELEMTDLGSGIYYITIETESGNTFFNKIIKY
jgi:hypothetical protein